MSVAERSPGAEAAYAEFAEFYDRYTEHADYASWVAGLLEHARSHGFGDDRVLDVGAGTGKSTAPLLAAGLDVVATEPVAAMRARARRALGDSVAVLPHAAGDLPRLGSFGLAVMLNDVVNYLLDEEELIGALRAIAANLAVGGLLLFDANTLATFAAVFARTEVVEDDEVLFVWRGRGDGNVAAGMTGEATLDAFCPSPGERWRRVSGRHVQRHHPFDAIADALRAAGFELVDVFGQDAGGRRVSGPPDELAHRKWIYLARKP